MAKVEEKDVEAVLPCLAGQVYHLASWVKSDRKSSEGIFAYRCPNTLSVDALRQAWRGLRQRHSILRSLFVAVTPGEAVQVVMTASAVDDESFQCIESEAPITDHIKQQAQQHFGFSNPPCLLQLIRGSTETHILLKLHHATYDAWTVPSLISDLSNLYNNIQLPEPPPFTPFITKSHQSRNSQPSQLYWRTSLAGSEPTLLPILPPHPSTSIPTFTTLRPALRDLQVLDQTCRASSLTLSTIILTAFARALASRTATTNPVLGLYQTGRSAGNENLSTPCLNITPVCVRDVLTKEVAESARGVQEDLAERVAYEQDYLGDVLEVAGFGRAESVFNSFINILAPPPATAAEDQNSPFTPVEVPDEVYLFASSSSSYNLDPTPTSTLVDGLATAFLAQNNLYLDVVRDEVKGCVDFAIKCDGELLDEDGVRGFMDEIVREVEGCVSGL